MNEYLRKSFVGFLFIPSLLLAVGTGYAADIQDRTLKFALQTNPGTAQYDGAEKFAELVDQKSEGKITIRIFGGGTLGKDIAVTSAMQGGTIEMSLMNASLLNGVVKEFSVFDFPYLFNDEKEAYAVLDGPIGKKLLDKLPEKGLVGLAYPELGFRHMHNNRRPITKLEDIQGLKIRVIETPVYIDFVNALGANATPIPFPEVFTALETGTVDGATNPLITIPVMKFDEVQKYLSLTRHMYNPQIILISKRTWDTLSEDERKILQDAANEATDYEREVSQKKNVEALETLEETMEVNEVPPEEIERMKEKAQPVIDRYTKEVGEELVKEVYAEIEKVRGGK